MENLLNITALNDFIFCPASIYFHSLYDGVDKMLYQNTDQINGTKAHEAIDTKQYSGSASLQSFEVYCEKYHLIGKIDLYDISSKTLIERKKKVKAIYDGYIFQLYAQYFAMTEMGYEVKSLIIRSLDDNKNYNIELPQNDVVMFKKFEKVITDIDEFSMSNFVQTNPEKCKRCIYAPCCDREV
jgi:CRISPR-associated protein Cas4